jgi:glycosyltransferase involved in cell wall biosynthesis
LLRISGKLLRLGKKVIYDAHEDLPRQILAKGYLPGFSRKLISYVVEKYENKKVRKLTAVVAATPTIRDRFLKVNSRTIDVNNYPALKELNLTFNGPRSFGGRKICYVGGITRIRGIVELVRAMNEIDGELLLAGEFLETGLRDELTKLPGWSKVREMGFLNRDQVREVYMESSVGIVTLHPVVNYLDSLPVKMFEYMACGLPVVASNFPEWVRLIRESDSGICVNPLDPGEISTAVNDLLSNPEKAGRMGENGHRLVIEKYNWENESAKLVQLYSEID